MLKDFFVFGFKILFIDFSYGCVIFLLISVFVYKLNRFRLFLNVFRLILRIFLIRIDLFYNLRLVVV